MPIVNEQVASIRDLFSLFTFLLGATCSPIIGTQAMDPTSYHDYRPVKVIATLVTHKGTKFDVHEGENVIGRSKACDIVLVDPSVSDKHAIIDLDIDEESSKPLNAILKDLRSKNGTFVSSLRLGRGNKVYLAHKDIFKVGTVDLTFLLLDNKIANESGEDLLSYSSQYRARSDADKHLHAPVGFPSIESSATTVIEATQLDDNDSDDAEEDYNNGDDDQHRRRDDIDEAEEVGSHDTVEAIEVQGEEGDDKSENLAESFWEDGPTDESGHYIPPVCVPGGQTDSVIKAVAMVSQAAESWGKVNIGYDDDRDGNDGDDDDDDDDGGGGVRNILPMRRLETLDVMAKALTPVQR